MGYRVDTSALLILDGMDGAEVSVTIGISLASLVEFDLTDTREDEWAKFLVHAKPAWNLEDADGAIPTDETALQRLPSPVSRSIVLAWRKAVVNPPAPLSPPSGDGEPSTT